MGVIYNTTPSAAFALESAVQQLDLAVYAEDGSVVGTHRSFRLEGGPEFDEDEARKRVLAEAYVLCEREQGSLRVATFGYDEMPVQHRLWREPFYGEGRTVGHPGQRPEPVPTMTANPR